jgi:membrane protein YdbS with pleckstrin-like domain
MEHKLQENLTQLKTLNTQRKLWLLLSFFVIITILVIVFDWQHIQYYKLEWSLVTSGLVLTASWWYWTMKLIRQLIDHKTVEYSVLKEIAGEIKSIKKDVRKSFANTVDNDI